MARIKKVWAREILDSRGHPTLSVTVTLVNGISGTASVPAGASTGRHEAKELRDKGKRYGGLGVRKAVTKVNKAINRALRGREVTDQVLLDRLLIELDGTSNKRRLGANAVLGASLASAVAAAKDKKIPLYRYLAKIGGYGLPKRLPVPMMNIINGGAHAASGLDVQEYMIVPKLAKTAEAIRAGAEIFQALKNILRDSGYGTTVGDEGGFAPLLNDNEQPLRFLVKAIRRAGYRPKTQVGLAIDMAASEFYDGRRYHFGGKRLTAGRLINWQQRMIKKYPLMSVEDGLAEDDWNNWRVLTKELKSKVLLVGDDLFTTNLKRLERGINSQVANAILIKPNQIGTLSETLAAVKLAQAHGYRVIVSHRSGETADTFIVDLAVGVGADYLKSGSLSRSERVEKYNRLMAIAAELKK